MVGHFRQENKLTTGAIGHDGMLKGG